MLKDNGEQIARIRTICSTFPGTTEKLSHGEPTFFAANKKVFTMFSNNHHNDGRIAVWLPAAPGVQEALVEELPSRYFRPPYVGKAGWIGIELSQTGDDVLAAHIGEAWNLIMASTKAPKKKSRS